MINTYGNKITQLFLTDWIYFEFPLRNMCIYAAALLGSSGLDLWKDATTYKNVKLKETK